MNTLEGGVILELGKQGEGSEGWLGKGQPLFWGHCPALTAAWSTTITSSTKRCCAAARLPWGQRGVRVLIWGHSLWGKTPG